MGRSGQIERSAWCGCPARPGDLVSCLVCVLVCVCGWWCMQLPKPHVHPGSREKNHHHHPRLHPGRGSTTKTKPRTHIHTG
jgi:hypothetical protein